VSDHDKDRYDSIKFFKGCTIGLIVSVPIWVSVYMLTSWLIGR
jgi:hypothetical protein